MLGAAIAVGRCTAQSPRVQELYAQAQAAQAAEQPEVAIARYRQILQLDPGIGPAYNNLGRIYFNQGRYGDAIATLTKGLQIAPEMAPAQVMLGASYLALGQPAEALSPLQAGVQALPADRFARMSLVRAEMALHRPEDALAQLNALLAADPNDQEAWYLAGKLHLQISQDAFAKVQSIDANTPVAHVMEGEIMESMQNTPGAVAAYKQAIASGNGAGDGAGKGTASPAGGGEDAGALQHLASLYLSTGDWAHAREQYTVLLQRQPRDCVARWHLAKAMDELSEPPEAGLRELNTALAQCPSLAEAHAERAKLLLRSGPGGPGGSSGAAPGSPASAKAALEDLLTAEKAAPDEPSVQQLLARCYRVLGDPAKSEAANRRFEQLQQQLHQAAERHASSVVQANQ